MPNFLGPVYVNQNIIHAPVVESLSSAPSSPKTGQFYFDTTLISPQFWNGTAMVPTDASKLVATIPNTALAPSALNRANQNGVQLAATISNLSATVQAYTLDQFAPAAAFVSMGGNRLENVATPVAGTDAATMAYVQATSQASAAGIVSKQACAVVSVTNQAALSGLLTIDGVVLTAGARVLLVAQTTAAQNGPYIAAAGAWTRSINDTNGELDLGATWFVEQGTTYSSSTWRLATPTSGAIVTGTTAVTIQQLTAANTYIAQNGVSLTGNTFAGVVAPAGGLVVGATGFAVDTTLTARKYSTNIGDGTSLSYTITHGLGTLDIVANVRDQSGNVQITDWQAASTTTLIATFSVAPTANQYRITVVG